MSLISAPEVKSWAASNEITQGYGTRGRVAGTVVAAFIAAQPKRAREHAQVVGLALASKRGRLSKGDQALVLATVKH